MKFISLSNSCWEKQLTKLFNKNENVLTKSLIIEIGKIIKN